MKLLLRRKQDRASGVYDLIGTRHCLGEKSLYLNLGYWDGAQTYDSACQALAHQLAQAASFQPGDWVLDVGFGFGDQDSYWAEAFQLSRIIGLNITKSQVMVAMERTRQSGLPISLFPGSSTAMPLASGSFDKVAALETAFHYDTREDFFRESYRVLKPGGRLAVADIIPRSENGNRRLMEKIGEYWGRRFWQIPKENMYPWPEYRNKLEAAGFQDVEMISIADRVFEPFADFARQRLKEPRVFRRMHLAIWAAWYATVQDKRVWRSYDYILVTATKPSEAL